MEETNSAASGKIVTALIIGLLVGFALGVFWEKRRTVPEAAFGSEASAVVGEKRAKSMEAEETAAPETAEKPAVAGAVTAPAPSDGFAIQVANQPAGNSVRVAVVSAKTPVWVAVREEKNGALGNILGAQKVSVAGESKDIIVDLLRPTVASGKYAVVLYVDAGSPAFNYREDMRVAGVQELFEAVEK